MGRRVKPRFKMVLPVRLWGTDSHGKPFNVLGYTLDISAGGARLAGIEVELGVDEVIAVQYKQQKARFQVKWVRAARNSKDKQFGIEYLPGEKFIWVDLPSEDFVDAFGNNKAELMSVASGGTDVATDSSNSSPADAEQSGSEDQLRCITELLENSLGQLRQAEDLISSACLPKTVADAFHDAVGHTRNTCLALQQCLDLQQQSEDPSPVTANVYSERMRFSAQLCQALSQHEMAEAGVSEEHRRTLASAIQGFRTNGALEPSTKTVDPVKVLAEIDRRIREANMPVMEALQFITEQVCSVLRVTGAAIALRENTAMVCCASSGWAPDIRVRFDESEGLAGEAIAARRLLVCSDTQNDSRVDGDHCRNVNLRSCVVVPISYRDQVVGVLEAFSSEPHAFSRDAVALLQQVADLVSSFEPAMA